MKDSSPLDIKNNRSINEINKELLNKAGNESLGTVTQNIYSDMYLLSQLIANKQEKFVGLNTTLTIITGVNFASGSVSNKTLTISNGIITGVN